MSGIPIGVRMDPGSSGLKGPDLEQTLSGMREGRGKEPADRYIPTSLSIFTHRLMRLSSPSPHSPSISGIVLPSSKMPVPSHKRTQTAPPSTLSSRVKGTTSSRHNALLLSPSESGDRPRETRPSQLKQPSNHHVLTDSTQLPRLQASSMSGYHSSRSRTTAHPPLSSSDTPSDPRSLLSRKVEHSYLRLRTDLTAPFNPAETSPRTTVTVASGSGVTRLDSPKTPGRSGEPRSRSKSEKVIDTAIDVPERQQTKTSIIPLSIPKLQRTPPTPSKRFPPVSHSRADSFLFDSLPLPSAKYSSRLAAPVLTTAVSKPTPIRRSKSNPTSSGRGRSSPCLRIPSPKFFSKEDSQSVKLQASNVSPPVASKEKERIVTGTKARRTTHGSFDFERPRSRESNRTGYSESKSAPSDDEKPRLPAQVNLTRGDSVRRSPRLPTTHEMSSPVPPMPDRTPSVPNTRLRQPAPIYASHPRAIHTHVSPTPDDDTVLPRLSSSTAQHKVSSRYYSPKSRQIGLPHFPFESPAPISVHSSHSSDKRMVDLGLRLAWAPSQIKEGAMLPKLRAAEVSPETLLVQNFKDALTELSFLTFMRYVKRFDEQIIPLDGPSGLILRAQRLLDAYAPHLTSREKRDLLSRLEELACKTE